MFTFDSNNTNLQNTESQLITNNVQENIPEDVQENAFASALNTLIQHTWELIDEINSFTATFKLDYSGDNISQIQTLLDSLSDDTTANIGIMHKILELISGQSAENIAAGEDKAEKLISETDPKDISAEDIESIESLESLAALLTKILEDSENAN